MESNVLEHGQRFENVDHCLLIGAFRLLNDWRPLTDKLGRIRRRVGRSLSDIGSVE